MLSTALAGWRMYQKMQPVIATLVAKYMAQRQEAEAAASAEPEAAQNDPAAAI
jgi:hypothetical protein